MIRLEQLPATPVPEVGSMCIGSSVCCFLKACGGRWWNENYKLFFFLKKKEAGRKMLVFHFHHFFSNSKRCLQRCLMSVCSVSVWGLHQDAWALTLLWGGVSQRTSEESQLPSEHMPSCGTVPNNLRQKQTKLVPILGGIETCFRKVCLQGNGMQGCRLQWGTCELEETRRARLFQKGWIRSQWKVKHLGLNTVLSTVWTDLATRLVVMPAYCREASSTSTKLCLYQRRSTVTW